MEFSNGYAALSYRVSDVIAFPAIAELSNDAVDGEALS
jgi:hypothetical protein